MNINLTPEQSKEFKNLLEDLKQEVTTFPDTYKYKLDTPIADMTSNSFFQQENLKLEMDSTERPVSGNRSPAPSASNLACNQPSASFLKDFQSMYQSVKAESPEIKNNIKSLKGMKPTKTVLKYKN